MADAERAVRDLVKEHGTFVRNAKRGELWDLPGGRISLPLTPNDHRSWNNALARARRLLGTPADPGEVVIGTGAGKIARPDLAAMGIHLELRPLVRLVRSTHEVTLDAAALARLVGLDPNPGDREVVELELVDADGETVEHPVTLKLVHQAEESVE